MLIPPSSIGQNSVRLFNRCKGRLENVLSLATVIQPHLFRVEEEPESWGT